MEMIAPANRDPVVCGPQSNMLVLRNQGIRIERKKETSDKRGQKKSKGESWERREGKRDKRGEGGRKGKEGR